MITPKEVNDIVIVGGGTSAWVTAAMLLNNVEHLNVTVVDKEVGSPVGVGEGTLLSFDKVMSRCGFDINEWFFEIDATAKAGILFPGWGQKPYEDVWHPFFFPEYIGKDTTSYNAWTKNQDLNFNDYAQYLYDVSINHNKVNLGALEGYAFHIDAGKLVIYIQKKLENNPKFKLIKSEVVDVIRRDDGHVDYLKLKNESEIRADLFVDCTGFRGLLNHNQQRVTLEGRLFCDTALAAHVPYDDIDKELHPYVISEQVDHGWVWNIPVQTRIGSGLVFNRTMTSIDEAKKYFVEYWDNRITEDQLKVIDWTPYYSTNMWHENVVSIGLSGGFIEPLESTGIGMIIVGAEQLVFAIQARFYSERSVDYFNNLMVNYYENAIDFVSLHYAKPTKDTPFWNWVKETFVKSERQKFYEKQIQRTDVRLPIGGEGYMFCATNWICWLVQMGYKINPANDGFTAEQAREFLHVTFQDEQSRANNGILHSLYIERLKQNVQ